jgi:glycosyltransferase involved in cell wall biosynthesis
MSRGLPAVIGDAGSLPELSLGAAISVQADDISAIANAIERLLADEALRMKLGEEGKKRSQAYTWTHAADKTLGVLRRIGGAAQKKAA